MSREGQRYAQLYQELPSSGEVLRLEKRSLFVLYDGQLSIPQLALYKW